MIFRICKRDINSSSSLKIPIGLVIISLFLGSSLSAQTSSNADKLNSIQLGEKMSTGPIKSVEACINESQNITGKTVKMTGQVKQVCQAKGCWFAITGTKGESIRVTSLGYKFFVPINAAGKTATVEGVFGVKELSAEMAQHYEDDRVQGTSEKPRKITKSVKEYSIAATAVKLN